MKTEHARKESIVQNRNRYTDSLFEAILSLKSIDECYRFFEDACTVKEIIEISQRFEVARMLFEKKSYQTITAKTGVSSATIGRVNKCLMYGSGGYKTVLDRTKKQSERKN